MSIEITWLGHNAWSIHAGEHRVLLDPFLNDNPLSPVQGRAGRGRLHSRLSWPRRPRGRCRRDRRADGRDGHRHLRGVPMALGQGREERSRHEPWRRVRFSLRPRDDDAWPCTLLRCPMAAMPAIPAASFSPARGRRLISPAIRPCSPI